MKTILFAPTTMNLAETSRLIETPAFTGPQG